MISYGKIRPGEVNETTQLIHFMFMNYEPMTICNRLDPEKNLLLQWYFVDYTSRAGLTLVARDTDTGKVVGSLTHKDYALPPTPDLPRKYYGYIDMFEADIAMCRELEKPLSEKEYKVGELFQPFQICVLPEYSGKSVASELAARSVILGRELGFSEAIGECSVMASRKAFEKNGFKVINSLSFKEFEHNGQKPYESIEGELYLLWRAL